MYIFGRASSDVGRQKQQQKSLAQRKTKITQLGLQQGTKIIRGIQRRGKIERYEDVVVEITPDWRIRVKGLRDPIHPSLIIKVLE